MFSLIHHYSIAEWFEKNCANDDFREKYITHEVALCSIHYLKYYDTITSIYHAVVSLPDMRKMLHEDYHLSLKN
jgi:hypothetical protein